MVYLEDSSSLISASINCASSYVLSDRSLHLHPCQNQEISPTVPIPWKIMSLSNNMKVSRSKWMPNLRWVFYCSLNSILKKISAHQYVQWILYNRTNKLLHFPFFSISFHLGTKLFKNYVCYQNALRVSFKNTCIVICRHHKICTQDRLRRKSFFFLPPDLSKR